MILLLKFFGIDSIIYPKLKHRILLVDFLSAKLKHRVVLVNSLSKASLVPKQSIGLDWWSCYPKLKHRVGLVGLLSEAKASGSYGAVFS
jgi:hypothetical protein